jgi:hypothetical protein
MIIRQMGSVTDIDGFSKAVVSNGQCQIRLKNGEPVIRCFGKNDLDAIKRLRILIDRLEADRQNKIGLGDERVPG